jgi:hypothetical protein
MVELATGQGMVARLKDKGVAVKPLTKQQIVDGSGGAELSSLTAHCATPWPRRPGCGSTSSARLSSTAASSWRRGKDCRGDLPPVACWQQASIIRHKDFVPPFAKDDKTFNMLDRLFLVFDRKKQLLNAVK